jgi:hypothetical protein
LAAPPLDIITSVCKIKYLRGQFPKIYDRYTITHRRTKIQNQHQTILEKETPSKRIIDKTTVED